jgi:hypothetical protein
MLQPESEKPKTVGPDKWGKQPRLHDEWITSNRDELIRRGIDPARYRTGMVGAFVKDTNTALMHAEQFLDPDANLPPFFREKVPIQQANFRERVDWMLSTSALPEEWNKKLKDVLDEAGRQPWNVRGDLIIVQGIWNQVICEYEREVAKKTSPFKDDMDYYLGHNNVVGQLMLKSIVKK